MQTVVGLYDTAAKANEVKRILESKGFNSVSVIDQSGEGYRTGYEDTHAEHNTVGGKIKHFFSSLTGDETNGATTYPHDQYANGVSNGGSLVAVHVEENRVDEVADLLDQHGATEVQDEGGTDASRSYATARTDNSVYDAGDRNYGTGTGTVLADADRTQSTRVGNVEGYADRANAADVTATGNQVIPVVAEDLVVGKRQVSRGGVRVYSNMVSTPVTEQVNLHDERVVVDRRPADRPATEADFNPETRSIELTATGEEAVIGKNSRVVEEVVVGKQGSDRVQNVSDSVRHTEVNVEQLDADTVANRNVNRG